MAVLFSVKRTSTPGKVPATTDFYSDGALLVNNYDGLLYMRKNVSGTLSVVNIIAAGGAAAPVQSVAGLTGAITAVNLASQLTTLAPLAGAAFTGAVTFATTVGVTGSAAFSAGITFGSTFAASTTDLTKQLSLYSTTYGVSVTSTRMNLVVPTGATVVSLVNGVDITTVSGTGLVVAGTIGATSIQNTPIGSTTAATGAFTTVTASSTATAASFIPSSATVPTNGMYLSAANTLGFATNSAQRISIDPNGNLAIANANFRNLLEVGTNSANAAIRIGGIYSGSTGVALNAESSRHQINFSGYRDSQSDTIGAKIVGINYAIYAGGGAGNYYRIQYMDLAFFTLNTTPSSTDNTTEKMRITAAGLVGINTSAPGYYLDVNGTGNFSGSVSHGAGATFGSLAGSSSVDLSKHIALYSTTYGLATTANRINYVVPSSAGHYFIINGVDTVTVTALALTVNTAGTFTGTVAHGNGATFGSQTGASTSDLSKHIALYGTTFGFSITTNRLNYVSPGGNSHYFVIGGTDTVAITNTGMAVTGAITATSSITASNRITANYDLVAGSNSAIASQGAYIQWNRSAGNGETWLINQKGFGSGGIYFGESTSANVVTQGASLIAGALTITSNFSTPGTITGTTSVTGNIVTANTTLNMPGGSANYMNDGANPTTSNSHFLSFQGTGFSHTSGAAGAGVLPLNVVNSIYFNNRTGDGTFYGNITSNNSFNRLGGLQIFEYATGRGTGNAVAIDVGYSPNGPTYIYNYPALTSVNSAGTSGFAVNDWVIDSYSNTYQVTSVSSGTVTGLVLTKSVPQWTVNVPANPVTLTVLTGSGVVTTTALKVNLTWTPKSQIEIGVGTGVPVYVSSLIPTSATVPALGMYSAATNTLTFSTNTLERMRINSSGFVGINNNNPGYLLDVNGTGNFSGVVSVASGINCGNNLGASTQDTSKGLTLWAGATNLTYGFGITGGRLNIIVPTSQTIINVIGGVDVLSLTGTSVTVNTGTFYAPTMVIGNSTDTRGKNTFNNVSTSAYAANTDIGDGNRALVVQNPTTDATTAGLYAALTMQVNSVGSIGGSGGRTLGDIKFVRVNGSSSLAQWVFTTLNASTAWTDCLVVGPTGITANGLTVNGPATITGSLTTASLQGTPIGSTTPSTGAFTSLSGSITATGGTTARTLAAIAADVTNVKFFNAKGDGTTDDTTAIQAALTYGGVVFFPPGIYMINTDLNVTVANTVLKGELNQVIIRCISSGTFTNGLIRLQAAGCRIDGLTVDGNYNAGTLYSQTYSGIYWHGVSNCSVKNSLITRVPYNGINIAATSASETTTGIEITSVTVNDVGWCGISIVGGKRVVSANCIITATGYHAYSIDYYSAASAATTACYAVSVTNLIVDRASAPSHVLPGHSASGFLFYIAPGTSNLELSNSFLGNNSWLSGYQDGIGLGQDTTNVNNGILIDNCEVYNVSGFGIDVSNSMTVSNCVIYNASFCGIALDLDYGTVLYDANVVNNKIVNTAVRTGAAYGIFFQSLTAGSIYRNIVVVGNSVIDDRGTPVTNGGMFIQFNNTTYSNVLIADNNFNTYTSNAIVQDIAPPVPSGIVARNNLGCEVIIVTASGALDATFYDSFLLNYSSATTLSLINNGWKGKSIVLQANNGNSTLALVGGTGSLTFTTGAPRTLVTNQVATAVLAPNGQWGVSFT